MKEHPESVGKLWSVQLEIQALFHILSGDYELLVQLNPEDFYDSELRSYFEGMRKDKELNGNVSIASLDIILSEQESYKGFNHLLSVLDGKYLFVADYRTTVRELKKLRAKREASSFRSSANSAEEIPLEFHNKGAELQAYIQQKINPMSELADRIKIGSKYIPTGFLKLDSMLGGGIEEGGIFVLAANPGTGKTAFATTVAMHCISKGMKVCFCSLEMAEEQIAIRVCQSFWNESKDQVQKHIDDMKELPGELFTVSPHHKIESVLAALTSCLEADLFVIDYFQLIEGNFTNNHYANLEIISSKLKAFAFENKKPILLLSQLNRDMEKDRRNREPQLSDLRGTGALAQDAHVVAYIWDKNAKEDSVEVEFEDDEDIKAKKQKLGMVDAKEKPQTTSQNKKDLRLIVRKNRNGEVGKIFLDFNPITMRFSESDDALFRF